MTLFMPNEPEHWIAAANPFEGLDREGVHLQLSELDKIRAAYDAFLVTVARSSVPGIDFAEVQRVFGDSYRETIGIVEGWATDALESGE